MQFSLNLPRVPGARSHLLRDPVKKLLMPFLHSLLQLLAPPQSDTQKE